jgi:hypothetical protein
VQQRAIGGVSACREKTLYECSPKQTIPTANMVTRMNVNLSKFSLADTSARQVVGMLKATGSSDPDVLYAAKEEYGSTFATQRFQGLGLLITGALSSLTIILAVIGVPVAIFGWWLWQKGKRNIALVEASYAEYLSSIKPVAAPLAS